MRVAYEATALFPPLTGVGWYAFELVDAVARAAPNDEFLLFPVAWRTAAPLSAPRLPNVRVVRKFAPAAPLWTAWRWLPFPRAEWFVDCDVFHAPNYLSPPSRKPVVVTVHDVNFLHREWEGDADEDLRTRLPRVLRRAAAVLTVSEFTRDELVDWLPDIAGRVTAVPIAPHRRPRGIAAPSTGLPPGPPYVLMLGNVQPRKNLPLALDAVRAARGNGVDVRLVVAGRVDPSVDVDSLVAERGLGASDVVVTGYVDDGRVGALLANAEALVFPSLYEGFGMPLVEAMDAGVPVVALRTGATAETVGDAALLIDPGPSAIEAFADALVRVSTDQALKARLVAAGQRRAAAFTWERAAAQTLAVYRSLVA